MGMKRLSKFSEEFLQAASPVVIPHSSYTGLTLTLGDDEAVVTVHADSDKDGAFSDEVTMDGAGTHRWPNVDSVNLLYNSAFVKIAWDTGTLKVFQKG